ncbi:MAG: GIY-YIG nuclease family protein [Actinobacteria bacterium]|nr:GIY-YIG nuclease family protein [Actinomycetota bacterium]
MQLQLSLRVADRLHETLLVRGEPLDAVEAARLLIASPSAPPSICLEILTALVRQDRRFSWEGGESGHLSLTHWEIPDLDLADVPFVALDLETTGARAGASKITEVGAVRIEGFREVRHFGTLVNPQRPIPPMITQITGITHEMVADAPRIEEVMPELLEFLEGAVVVAHNAPFDVGFLNYELQRLRGRRLGEGAIDTLPLARALAPGLPNYRLRTVADALGAPVTACHRALADAQAAGHVFVTLAGRLQERGITRLSELRAYNHPSSRSVVEKLGLTRDLPKTPGTYRFLDEQGQILYVGKADRLRERVRSHFVESEGNSRKVRQALRMVQSIDWDETCTPLEAVVREHELILQHRPVCNVYGTRPEAYSYVKVTGGGCGLNLSVTSRPPRWLVDAATKMPHSRRPLLIGPFRGRTRMNAALGLIQRCYPIRRCPRHPDGHPCMRADHGGCLAPCLGDPQVRVQHDALVMDIVEWLTGRPDPAIVEPLECADDLIRKLSRQHRYEDAQRIREACDHLLHLRRSYADLAEARALCFAAFWPTWDGGEEPSVRLNVVWNGALRETATLHPQRLEEELAAALAPLWNGSNSRGEGEPASLIAVPQTELDSLLAIRRWFHEAGHPATIPIPGPKADSTLIDTTLTRLTREARRVLSMAMPPPGASRPDA